MPEVQERKLKNGVRILLVERPGIGAVHARLFLQGGLADTGALPAVAAELLGRCLFGPALEGEAGNAKELEDLLKQEEGTFESLRLLRIREARHPMADYELEAQDLEQLHEQAFDRIQKLERPKSAQDSLDSAGASRREFRADADDLFFGVDLPKEGLDTCLQYLTGRLKAPLLARFPLERDRMLSDLRGGGMGSGRKAMGVFLNTALSGQSYAQVYDVQRASLEATSWTDLRDYARWAATPNRLVLVLVGDVKLPEILNNLERSLGSLPPGPDAEDRRDEAGYDLPGNPGSGRLEASVLGERLLFMGWRVPPMTHPDHYALQVLAEMLGGGSSSRLGRKLQEERNLAQSFAVRLDVPGGRDVNLLLIEAKPAERHGLEELEQVIQGELIRLQRGAFLDGEIRAAQRQVEVDETLIQEDAAKLADALGTAQCQDGDWRLAFRAFQVKQDYTQQELQAVALRYFIPGQSTVALLEPDPILMPQDRLERETAEVLAKLLEAKLGEPGKVESIVRESLRQLRMLPIQDREQTLKLLESQVKP